MVDIVDLMNISNQTEESKTFNKYTGGTFKKISKTRSFLGLTISIVLQLD